MLHILFFSRSLSRFFLQVMLVWGCFGLVAGIQAQTYSAVIDLQNSPDILRADGLGAPVLPVQALQGLSASSTVKDAQAAKKWQVFEPQAIYELSGDHALWLKLKVQYAPEQSKRWALRLTKTFLDRIELYYQDNSGAWQMQQTGDNFAHSDWSLRSLSPQFKLPALAAGERELWIKIVQDFPQQIPLTLMNAQLAEQEDFREFLIAGLILGLLGLILLLAIHLAWSYRDETYAWYAVYALFSLLSVSAYLGSASYLFWPFADRWPEYSILLLIMCSLAAQLWFCQAMFLREIQAPGLKRLAKFVVGFIVVLIPLFITLPRAQMRIQVFGLGAGICAILMFWIVFQAWRNRQASARYWFVAYIPLILAVSLALAENLSLIAPTGLPYSTPAFTLSFEALILLFALHLHAKDRHAVHERERAMNFVDPLTGFLNAQTFNARLQRVWNRSRLAGQDVSVAYIQLHHRDATKDPQAALRMERRMLRSVRMLGVIMRDVDFAGRLGAHTLALCIPGIEMGESLNNRLSRIVALGQMVDKEDPESIEIRYRIAVSSLNAYKGNLVAMDNDLRAEIIVTSGWNRRPIHYIQAPSDETTPTPLPFNIPGENIAWASKSSSSSSGTQKSSSSPPGSPSSRR